jgi:hypothetical protein
MQSGVRELNEDEGFMWLAMSICSIHHGLRVGT